MDRGTWQAMVHGVAELVTTTHTHTHTHTHTESHWSQGSAHQFGGMGSQFSLWHKAFKDDFLEVDKSVKMFFSQFPVAVATNCHKLSGNRNILSYSSGGQKSEMSLAGANIEINSFQKLQGESTSLPFPASRDHLHFLACGQPFHLQSQQRSIFYFFWSRLPFLYVSLYI